MSLRFTALAMALWALPLDAQDAVEKGAQFFPLVTGSVYEYKGAFKGNEFKNVYVLKTHQVGDLTVTYFHSEGSPLIGSHMIGIGAFRVSNDSIETFEGVTLKNVDELRATDAQLLLPAALREGSETVVKAYGGDMLLKIVVKGREDITVPAGTYKNCLRLEMEQAWPKKDKVYRGTAWLAAGVGCVKRVNVTGRIDELVSVKIPGR